MNIQLAAACLLIGSGLVFMLISLIGIMRFPDFFTRLHAQGVGDTLGAFLIIAGMAAAEGAGIMSLKLLLIFVIIVLTNPLGTNLMMIAAVNKEDYQGYRTLLSRGDQDKSDPSEPEEPEISEPKEELEISEKVEEPEISVTKEEPVIIEAEPVKAEPEEAVPEERGPEKVEKEDLPEHRVDAGAVDEAADQPETKKSSNSKKNSKKKKSSRKRKPSMSMNRSELIKAAANRGIDVPEGATKREILDLIYAGKNRQ